MTTAQLIPLGAFALIMLTGIIMPFFSKETRALKKFLRNTQETKSEEHTREIYSGIIEKLTEYKDRGDISELERQEAEKTIEGLNRGTLQAQVDNSFEETLDKVVRTHIIKNIVGNTIIRLVTNLGFFIHILTGHWTGVLFGLFIFLGSALTVEHAVGTDPNTSDVGKTATRLLGIIAGTVDTLPLILAVIFW